MYEPTIDDVCFIFKQSNNGTTFIVSHDVLPHLADLGSGCQPLTVTVALRSWQEFNYRPF